MYIRQATVRHSTGLHNRAAVGFNQTANTFQSVIMIRKDVPGARDENAKSLLGVISLGIKRDGIVVLSAQGADEEAAVDALVDYLENPPEEPQTK